MAARNGELQGRQGESRAQGTGIAYLELSFPCPAVVVVVVPLAAGAGRVPGSPCLSRASVPVPVGQRDLLNGTG